MIIAYFHRGPYDGQVLTLPTEEPFPRFVIAEFEPIVQEFFYLLAGETLTEEVEGWAYLYEEDLV